MAGYGGAGWIFALGLRVTKLDSTGAPSVGASNAYISESLVKIGFGQNISSPNAIEQNNGKGQACVFYQPAPTLLNGTITDFEICVPDPILLSFLVGGSVIYGPNEIQTVTITGAPTGGTFTLTYSAQTTGAIAYNATASTVQTALEALSNIAPGDVAVGGGPGPGTAYTVTFTGTFAGTDVTQMTASGVGLTGGTTPTVTVTTTTAGGGGNAIGYRAPTVNTDPNPNGVAIEAWSRAVVNNAYDPTLPYVHWVVPRAHLTLNNSLVIAADNATVPALAGTCDTNVNFGDGPVGDIPFSTDRVWQWCQRATEPTAGNGGFVTVV